MKIPKLRTYMADQPAFVFDSGVMLAYIQDEHHAFTQILDDLIFSENSTKSVVLNQLTLTEIFYIHCHSHGPVKAEELLADIGSTCNVLPTERLVQLAAKLKCRYPIALSDCYSIASGIVSKYPVLFMNEREITPQILKDLQSEFSANVVIIEN